MFSELSLPPTNEHRSVHEVVPNLRSHLEVLPNVDGLVALSSMSASFGAFFSNESRSLAVGGILSIQRSGRAEQAAYELGRYDNDR
jgi:hypothetical protein